jgi:hypothetical protein
MKLMLPDLLEHIRSRKMPLVSMDGKITPTKPGDKRREQLLRPLLPLIHQAEKFIFDSGTDQDEETTTAVKSTVQAMFDFGLYHLPAPVIWIEDPFSDDQRGPADRNYYLCTERDGIINVYFLQSIDPTKFGKPRFYTVFAAELVLDLARPTYFAVAGDSDYCAPSVEKILGEVIYSVNKFIVTMAAPQTIRERVGMPKDRASRIGRRSYEHTIIRVPSYTPEPGSGSANGPQGKRRMGLVAGYVWGKNTRPVSEQRWIAPHWRGDATLGLVPAKVRVVEPRELKESK